MHFYIFLFADLEKIQLRDLSKFRLSLEEKLAAQHTQPSVIPQAVNDSEQSSLPQRQSSTSNPPLPPRSQPAAQSFSHRQSLSQFQPKSLYAHKEPPPPPSNSSTGSSQLPFQHQNYTPSTPSHYDQQQAANSQYNAAHAQNYKSAPTPPSAAAQYMHNYPTTNQTEQIHSQNPSQPAGYRTQQQQPQQSGSYLTSRNKPLPTHDLSNSYGHFNSSSSSSQLQRRPSVDQVSPHLMSKLNHDQIPPPHLPPKQWNYLQKQLSQSHYSHPQDKYPPPNQFPPSNSSQYQNVNSVDSQRDSVDGYPRASIDYTSPAQSNVIVDKTVYTNRINPPDPNESYQRTAALRRNSKPVTGESPYSFKQVRIIFQYRITRT